MNDPFLQPHPRILVVDDNRAIHDDFRKIFCSKQPKRDGLEQLESSLFNLSAPAVARSPFQIDSAFQGEDGVDLVRDAFDSGNPYAMAFVDVRMPPGIDGVQTATKIWQIDDELEIVICTAHSDYSWEEMTAKLSHAARLVILKKPFEFVEVLQLATSLTEKWRLHQQVKLHLLHLEKLVQDRTSDLNATNQRLETEIAARKKSQIERETLIRTLEEALANVNTLRGLIPICAGCKRIRDDKGFWNQVEIYVSEHSEARFSHGLCPQCARTYYPDVAPLRS
jgi:DNA-binding NtrC family response regulator